MALVDDQSRQQSLPAMQFGPDWEIARQSAYHICLAHTLGPYLAQQWIRARGDDPLVVFAFFDRVLVLEFARSGYFEIDLGDEQQQVPRLLLPELQSPEHMWHLALERAGNDERRAMAAILWLGHQCLAPEGLHDDSGEAFLATFGMERFR